MPNVHPPLGYDRALQKLLSASPIFGSLSTFGFAYNLDSKLLVDIANMGSGVFSFIPDAGMVGTCFINAIASSLCAYGVNPILRIKGLDGNVMKKRGMIVKDDENQGSRSNE